MKTLSFELSKRLNELKLLDNIETECSFLKQNGNPYLVENYEGENREIIKTLTLEEAIEFLPDCISINKSGYYIQMGKKYIGYYTTIPCGFKKLEEFYGNNILEAIEKMIEYLLDNNLLTK